MNEANFLQRMNGIVPGDGFVREVPIPLKACVNTNGTDSALISNMIGQKLQDDNDSITLPVAIPLDYDETQDKLAVVLFAQLTTGDLSAETNYITLDLDQVKLARPGAASVADKSSDVTSDAQTPDDATMEEYTWDLSGLGLKVGDQLSVEIDSQESGTAEVTIFGAALRYKSCLAAFHQTHRGAVDTAVEN